MLPDDLPDWQRLLLADPQTSGGLLVACAPEKAGALVESIRLAGYPLAGIVGTAEAGAAQINVIS